MNKELEETVLKVADYSNEEKRKMTRIMHWLYIAAIVSFTVFFILLLFTPEEPTFLHGYAEGVTLGIPFVMVLVGAVMTSKYAAKIRDFKKKILSRSMEN